MMRGLPSLVSSGGPGSFLGALSTDPLPTFVHVLCGISVTAFTSEAEAGCRPLMNPVSLFLFAPLANTNTSAPPTTITSATMIHAVRSVPFLALLAAAAVRPLRCWGRRLLGGCLLTRLLARKGRGVRVRRARRRHRDRRTRARIGGRASS